MNLVGNGRIWSIEVKTLDFGSKPNTRRDPRRELFPKRVFRPAFVWGFLDWHPIRDIKRG